MTAPSTQPFYGWTVVAATSTVMATAYGVQYTFGVFLPEIEADTGWSREALSLAFSVYVFLYGVLGYVTGWATDRYGPRVVIATGGVLLGVGYVGLSRVDAMWQVYVFLAAIAAAGMSAAFVPCSATVIRWFERLRGRALGLTTMGASVGNIVTPPLVALLIASLGWRATYLALGLGAALIVIAAAYFVVRDPGVMGLEPDGGAQAPASEPAAPALKHYPWTLAEARRTGVFWLLMTIFFLTWLVIFLPVVHLAPYAIDLGMDPVKASGLVSAVGVGGVAGRPLMGAISDRIGRIPALLLALGTQALAFALFSVSESWFALFLEAAAFGFAYGGGTTLFAAIVGDYYGPSAVGAIVGFVFAVAGSAAAFGPWFAGYVVASTGSYDAAFWVSAAVNATAFVLVFFVRRPAAPTPRESFSSPAPEASV